MITLLYENLMFSVKILGSEWGFLLISGVQTLPPESDGTPKELLLFVKSSLAVLLVTMTTTCFFLPITENITTYCNSQEERDGQWA